MYHPTRGGVRGGRDQFKWDDVKVDKHRENYLGHSIRAPVGRWQKGKDLHWYSRDKKTAASDAEVAKEEIRRIKEEEEQAMREALGLAPKGTSRPQGNRLDKHEYSELIKRGSTAEDLGAGHAEAAQVEGLGLYKGHNKLAQSSSIPEESSEDPSNVLNESPLPPAPLVMVDAKEAEETPEKIDHEARKKRRREEKKYEKEKKHERHERKHSRDSDGKRHRKHEERRRHDSGSE